MAEFKLGRLRFVWKGVWASGTPYVKDDVIRHKGNSYVCTTGHTSSAVFYTDSSHWNTMTDGQHWSGIWDSQLNYYIGDMVKNGAYTYIATANSYGKNPSSETAFWDIVSPGIRWLGNWVTSYAYKLGDSISFGSNSYICIAEHTSGTLSRPDNDTLAAYWNGLTAGASESILTTTGDLIYYGAAGTARLPVGEVGQVLQSGTNSSVFWDHWGLVDNVFYVAPNGVDEAGYGRTLTAPFKSVRYACNYVSSRTMFTVATGIVGINKLWLQYELYYWMQYQSANNKSPFFVGSTYDQTASLRDTGLIIDALVYDLSKGTNSETVAAALSFFQKGDVDSIYNANTLAAVPYIVASLTQLRSMIGNLFANVTPTYNYQTLMTVPTLLQKQRLIDPQFVPEAGAETAVNQLLDIIITALTLQTTQKVPTQSAGATIFVKTGTFVETLPITIPERVALVGDELRGTVIQAAGSLIPSVDVFPTLDSMDRLRIVINDVIQNITVTPTYGNTTPQDVSNDVGTPLVALNATNIIQSVYDYINFKLNAIGTQPALVGTNQLTGDIGVIYSIENLKANKQFIADEIHAYTQFTYKTSCTATSNSNNRITCSDSSIFQLGMAIRFTGTTFGGILTNTTYYILSKPSSTTFTVALAINGVVVPVTNSTGTMVAHYWYNTAFCNRDTGMYVEALIDDLMFEGNWNSLKAARWYCNAVAGSQQEDMFYVRNGTGIRNMTLNGLNGTLSAPNSYGTRRPTAGAYVSFDPSWGTTDKTAQISTKSPYIQNVTTFGSGCIGLKLDSDLHASGNRSVVANDFTQVLSDGIGVWCKGVARTELVSVFTYYSHIGYLAEDGGKIRATNGNNSYGLYGSVSEGVDLTETPSTAAVNNRAQQALVGASFTDQSKFLWLEYTNAGQSYAGTVNYTLGGGGFGAAVSAANIYDNAVCEVRIANGGSNYVTVTNTAQSGTATQITLSASDSSLSAQYIGMRILITLGLGVGQYGYIGTYSSSTKIATILKESDGTSGWDVAVSGTAVISTLNDTTRYIIEPRVTFAGVGTGVFARAVVVSNQISAIRIIQPGAGYTTAPTMTITDPNKTINGTYEVRVANGVLGQPTWSNRGTSYTAGSAIISGTGFSDNIQTGAYVNISNLSVIPAPGATVSFAGNSQKYKLVSIANVSGTLGSYTGRLQLSPYVLLAVAPLQGVTVTIREKYSQVRLTGHDFLDVGVGNFASANFPGDAQTVAVQANEIVESNGGRCFYTSTDQDGNFRVGDLFKVEQSTGIATLNADAFNLSGLNELSLGAVALGGSGAVIREFSTDSTFSANADYILSTQKATRAYISSQIGGGGTNLAANSLTVGSIYAAGTTITSKLAADLTISADTGKKVILGTTTQFNGATTITAAGSLTISGTAAVTTGITLTINSGGTLTAATGSTTNLNGTISLGGSATMTTGNTLTINSGATFTVAGTGNISTAPTSGNHITNKTYVDGLMVSSWTTIATATSAVVKTNYFANTAAAPFILTLPASPSANDQICIVDLAGTFDRNSLTIARNGLLIMGAADNLVLNIKNASVTLVYSGATYGWKLV